MGNSKRHKLCVVGIYVVLSLIIISCNYTKPVIIDGAKAREIENRINALAFDEDLMVRGNTPSNIRNGGNLIMDDQNLYVIQEMEFNDDVSYYLQKIFTSSIGSLSVRDNLLTNLNGSIVALKDNTLYYVDHDSFLATSLNLDTLEKKVLFKEPVSSFRVFDETGYISTISSKNIYTIRLQEEQEAKLLTRMGGTIVGMNDQTLYTVENGEVEGVIKGYDRKSGVQNFSLTGGPFLDAEISGSFVYFKDGETLRRLLLDNTCECESASVLAADEYAIYGKRLVISAPSKGLYLSNLDGSNIILLSEDKGKDIQLFDDKLFYRNEFDYNEWYQIEFSSESRSALIGETITDGGHKFIKSPDSLADAYSAFYELFVDSVRNIASNRNIAQERLGSNILFVDTRGERYEYFTHIDYSFSPQDCDALVVITNKNTLLGKYTDNTLAYRKDTILTLFRVGDENPLLSEVVRGYPPIDIKSGEGNRFGLPVSWHQMALSLIERMK